jgi:hypothetical protein
LLQRVLCSHPEILVWGENRGFVDRLVEARRAVEGLQSLSREHVERFSRDGSMGWIAMMNPPIEALDDGLRRLLEAYFYEPSQKFGKRRWGFKEVRHGRATAELLQRLYPGARFVLLARHPEDCLASARAPSRGDSAADGGILAEAGGAAGFLEHWARLAADFADEWPGVGRLLLRYEYVVADPGQAIEEIARLLEVDPSGFDRRVFENRQRGWEHRPRLTREDRRRLEAPWLWASAERLGYEPRRRDTVRGATRQFLDSLIVSVQGRRSGR